MVPLVACAGVKLSDINGTVKASKRLQPSGRHEANLANVRNSGASWIAVGPKRSAHAGSICWRSRNPMGDMTRNPMGLVPLLRPGEIIYGVE